MRLKPGVLVLAAAIPLAAQNAPDDPNARPPVDKTDIAILRRASAILDSPYKWNRADNRVCPEKAKTFSLYCALEEATKEKSGKFEHRGAAMQEARFVIDEIAPNAGHYSHRLMDYNNDPATTFADVQRFFHLLEDRIGKRLAGATLPPPKPVAPAAAADTGTLPVTETDLKILARARQILDSPTKWDRADTQRCDHPKTVSLFCAFQMAGKEVTGSFNNSAVAIEEARILISEMDPQRTKYRARLTDFNNDPAITLADIQKLFQTIQDRLEKRLASH
jgi:hypothetical protein